MKVLHRQIRFEELRIENFGDYKNYEFWRLKNFGEVQRNVCWLFDLELAIIGSGYLLLALSRHPDLLSCAGGWGHVFF